MSSKKRPKPAQKNGYVKSSNGFDKTAFVKTNRAAARALTKEYEKRAQEAHNESKLNALTTDVGGPDDGTTSLHLERIFDILQNYHLNNPSDPFMTSEDLVKRARLEPALIYPKLKRSLEDPKSRYRYAVKGNVVSYAIKLRHYAHDAATLVENMRQCYSKHGYRGENYKNNLEHCYKHVYKDLKKLKESKKLIVIDMQDKNKPVDDYLVFYANPKFGENEISDDVKAYWERAKSDGPSKRAALLRKYDKPLIKTFRPVIKMFEPEKEKKKRAGRSNVALSNSHLKNFPGNL